MLHHGTLLCETKTGKTCDRMTCLDICGEIVGIGTSSGTIAFYDVVVDASRLKASVKHIATPPTNTRTVQNRITCLKFSPCARYLAIGIHSGLVSIFRFDACTCQIRSLYSYHEHIAPISCLGWTDDSSRVYSGCYGGRVLELNLSRLPSDDLLQLATSFFSRPTSLVEQCLHTIHAIYTYLSPGYDYLLIVAGHSVVYYQLSRASSDSSRRNVIDKSHHAHSRYSACFLTQDSSIQLFRLPPTATKTQSVSIIVCRPGTTQLFTCAVSNGSMYHCYDLESIDSITAKSFSHLQPIYYEKKLLGILALTSSHQLAVIHLPSCTYQVLPIYQDITAIYSSEQYILACISDVHFMVDVIQWFHIREWRLPMRMFTTNLHLSVSLMQSRWRVRKQPAPASRKVTRWEVLYDKIQESLVCAFASSDMELEKYNLELGCLSCGVDDYTPLINLDEILQMPGESGTGAPMPMRRQSKVLSMEYEQLVSLATHAMLNDMIRREQLQCIVNASAATNTDFSILSNDDKLKEIDSILDSSYELLGMMNESRHARTVSDCSHISAHSMDIDALCASVDMYTNRFSDCGTQTAINGISHSATTEITCSKKSHCIEEGETHKISMETECLRFNDANSDCAPLTDGCSEVMSVANDGGIEWLRNCGDSWIDAWHDAVPSSDMGIIKCRLGRRRHQCRFPVVVDLSPDEVEFMERNTYIVTLRVPHGIGINLSYENGALVVKGFSDLGDHENPALLSGLIQPGDVLIGVNNEALDHLPIDLALRVIRSFLDASSKADDPITLTFQYGDTYQSLLPSDAENPLFDIFTSISGEELVVAEHLIQNNFVSDDSLSTPSRAMQVQNNDEPWFSVAELLRERIRAAHVYPTSAVVNACSSAVDSRVLLSGIVSDIWNCEVMRRKLKKHFDMRKVVPTVCVPVPLDCGDARHVIISLEAIINKTPAFREIINSANKASKETLSVQIPDADATDRSTAFPVVRYLLQRTLRNVHSPVISPLNDPLVSPTLESLQKQLVKQRRQSESGVPDSIVAESMYNFIRAAPIIVTPDILKLLRMLIDSFCPVQPVSCTNHISNKCADKQFVIVEKLVTLYALFVMLKPGVHHQAYPVEVVSRLSSPPDILMYRDGLQSYVNSFFSDFSIDIRHLSINEYVSSEAEVRTMFEKYGNYINLDIFAIVCSIRQFHSLLHRCVNLSQNHALVRTFQQKANGANAQDHFYMLSATNKMSSRVYTYSLAQLPSLWASQTAFATMLCVSLFPYVTAWNVHQQLQDCFPVEIAPAVHTNKQMQYKHSIRLNQRGIRVYYHYLRQVLSFSGNSALYEPTSIMILHFIECCLLLHEIDRTTSYLDDMQQLEADVALIDQRNVALVYLQCGYISGVVDKCYSYLSFIEEFGFSLDCSAAVAFRRFDSDFALQVLSVSLEVHLRTALSRADYGEECRNILSDILGAIFQYTHLEQQVHEAEAMMKKLKFGDYLALSMISFNEHVLNALQNTVNDSELASGGEKLAEAIALGIYAAYGGKICVDIIKKWPWLRERLKFSFYRKIAQNFDAK